MPRSPSVEWSQILWSWQLALTITVHTISQHQTSILAWPCVLGTVSSLHVSHISCSVTLLGENGFGLCLGFLRKSEPQGISPWSALPSCLLLDSFEQFGRTFESIWGGCHLVTGFAFRRSAVEQYWGVVKQRHASPMAVEQKAGKGTGTQSWDTRARSPALSLLQSEAPGRGG